VTTLAEQRETVELELEGMTCAACAARIERRLNGVEGAAATVNYATEVATVSYDPALLDVERLVDAVTEAGYGAHLRDGTQAPPAGDHETLRLVLTAIATVPIVALGMIPATRFADWEWVALALTLGVVAVGGWPFHRSAARALRHGTLTMDTLVSLGTLVAFGWSAAVVLLGLDEETYFETAAVITTFVLTGRWLEHRARRRSREALTAVARLGAGATRVVRDGVEVELRVDELVVGDLFVVRPGESIATDGIVVEGESAVDVSMVTGEPLPVDVAAGAELVGGTVNLTGRLVVRATAVGRDTVLARIEQLVARAQAGKADVQRLADRVSQIFVPVVVAIAAATLVLGLAFGRAPDEAVVAAVAVLIIACPCALGLATPTALLVGTGRAAQLGILIRGPEVLERVRRVTAIALDKTGTLTSGEMTVSEVVAMSPGDEGRVLELAAAAESGSAHPLARAIVAAAGERELAAPESFRSTAGVGVEARVAGHRVTVGRGGDPEAPVRAVVDRIESEGRTAVVVEVDGVAAGVLAIGDMVLPTSGAALAALRGLGLDPVMLTGDAQRPARVVADRLGIERVVAGVLPAEKEQVVAELQQAGEIVAMVGDGVNDAPALARADLGMALGSGLGAAIEAADVTLMSTDLRIVVDAIKLARRTLATIRVNLFWAFAYNVAAIPIAAAGILDPSIAAATMALSSIFVFTNSLRLRRFRSLRT